MADIGGREERQRRIHDLLAANGRMAVEALARRLRVTTMTIRRDLAQMEAAGLLLRVHGGCVLQTALVRELSYSEKAVQRRAEKLAIARAAVRFFAPGSSIYLDTGTTAAAIAQALPAGLSLRVFTNNLRAAMDLFGRRDVAVHVYGGALAARSPDLVGPAAVARVLELRTDWAVLGADAVAPATGEVFAADMETAALSDAARRRAARVMVVADSSKLGPEGLAVTARLASGVVLVTDSGCPAALRRRLARTGAEILCA